MMTFDPAQLFTHFDPMTGLISGAAVIERRLSDLRGVFADETAYAAACVAGDPLLYTVAFVEPAQGEGALNYALGCVYPGRIGGEYHLTKGHFHAWRAASEYYIGLRGAGMMLFEAENGESWAAPLTPNSAVYVPGCVAHRTVNVGSEPLTYLGIYLAGAGHDYAAVAERNFCQVVVEVAGRPTVMRREEYLKLLAQQMS